MAEAFQEKDPVATPKAEEAKDKADEVDRELAEARLRVNRLEYRVRLLENN